MQVQKNKAVATWLWVGAIMIIIQILLGGITRLTGSGLSITEWKPILGALPPMNEQQWNEAFDKYKQIAQYKYIHNYFSLSDFKFIYFWEWFHRNWGRFMGVVFVVPFIYFIYTKKINRTMLWPMVVLFILGGLQGVVGWVMVSSGVGTELVYVDHVRLATHFIAALVLLVYVIWFALQLSFPLQPFASLRTLRRFTILLLMLLTVQLIYGAFMAGTHAAKAAITWPSINGSYYPPLFVKGHFWQQATHDLVSIQFIHRNLAYLLAVLMLVYTFLLYRLPRHSTLHTIRFWPILLTLVQIVLGILALVNYLNHHKLMFSIFHQLVGILLLISLVITYYFTGGKRQHALS